MLHGCQSGCGFLLFFFIILAALFCCAIYYAIRALFWIVIIGAIVGIIVHLIKR
ncbi:MAG: hypothetical protein PHI94_05065 [Eubacteriaceae bacterium]|nr:hypothetical protein [Eubacteriaceae bacterium]